MAKSEPGASRLRPFCTPLLGPTASPLNAALGSVRLHPSARRTWSFRTPSWPHLGPLSGVGHQDHPNAAHGDLPVLGLGWHFGEPASALSGPRGAPHPSASPATKPRKWRATLDGQAVRAFLASGRVIPRSRPGEGSHHLGPPPQGPWQCSGGCGRLKSAVAEPSSPVLVFNPSSSPRPRACRFPSSFLP